MKNPLCSPPMSLWEVGCSAIAVYFSIWCLFLHRHVRTEALQLHVSFHCTFCNKFNSVQIWPWGTETLNTKCALWMCCCFALLLWCGKRAPSHSEHYKRLSCVFYLLGFLWRRAQDDVVQMWLSRMLLICLLHLTSDCTIWCFQLGRQSFWDVFCYSSAAKESFWGNFNGCQGN